VFWFAFLKASQGSKRKSYSITISAMNVPPMVAAIISLRPSLPPVSDELRKRVQSIRVRSVVEAHTTRTSSNTQSTGSPWRHKQNGPSAPPGQRDNVQRDTMGGNWRQSSSVPTTPVAGTPFRFLNQASQQTIQDRSPRPTISRPPSFINALNSQSPGTQESPRTPLTPGPPARYISKFHNGSKIGDDQILNTVILNKLNVFSVKTYDDVKSFLFQILGSDQKEFIREFTWLVFRKAAAEEKFCGLFAKLLSEIKKEFPVIFEEMKKLHTIYLDIWKVSETDSLIDKRCRLGYSQFLAELTALEVLDAETMRITLECLKGCIHDCLKDQRYTETVEEYMDCLKQLCGSKVPKTVKHMICEILVKDLAIWIDEPKALVPGLSTKSRFACMDLKDLLIK
jgi:hypothetical protein